MLEIFIYFPEKEEEVYEIVDCEFLKEFFSLFELLKKENNWKLHYDETNLSSFLSIADSLGLHETHLSMGLRAIIGRVGSVNLRIKPLSKYEDLYFRYNRDSILNIFYSHFILSEIAERIVRYNNEDNIILLNLFRIIPACRDKILIFKDSISSVSKLQFANINFITNKEELAQHFIKHPSKFTLLNKNHFTRTNFVCQGQTIFQEVVTKNYWYLDNFHKNEYEVFNSNREHIGVADLNGKLDTTKKVNGRIF